jgi:site-specific DNA-methyltransferase (adenine-specific)
MKTSSDQGVQLRLGECLGIMASLPPKSVDLILCDLPYGTTRNKWDSIIPLNSLWAEYRRIAKGPILLFAAQPFTSALVMSNPDWFRYDLVWRKNKASGHLNAKRMPLRAHESILVFYDDLTVYNAQMTRGHKPANYAKRTTHSTNYGAQGSTVYEGGNTERYPTSVLDWPVVNNDDPDRSHPTQKPVGLCEWLIRSYSDEGATVLDNTMGSGTTGVASVNTDRHFIGIERDPDYFEIARTRIDTARRRHGPSNFDLLPAGGTQLGLDLTATS